MYIEPMPKEKQEEVVGRLTIEYSQAKIYVSRLEVSIREVREKIQALPVELTRADGRRILDILNSVDFEELKANAHRLIEAQTKSDELREQLRKCGVNF